jgi:ATP-dependent Clp protease adaptor protein ClpS
MSAEPESTATVEPDPQTTPRTASDAPQPRRLPPYAVVVYNDDRHTFDYVIETFGKVFGHNRQRAAQLAWSIHREGRGIVWSGPKEVAELKRDQVRSAGPDLHASPPVKFPLRVDIEPLPG